METINNINRPSKEEQELALESFSALASVLAELITENPEIEIEETKDKITLQLSAFKFLSEILKTMSKGKPFSLIPIATTQKAA